MRAALARQMLLGGEVRAARSLLEPLAYEPHAVKAKDVPLQLIELIDSGKIAQAKQLVTEKSKGNGNRN